MAVALRTNSGCGEGGKLDIEHEARIELIAHLGANFVCQEEVNLHFHGRQLKCDVLARPLATNFEKYIFAFEVKRPDCNWHHKKWARTIKQACDYVGASVLGRVEGIANPGDIVTASFVYPAPHIAPSERPFARSEIIREGFENAIAGMFHLALMFRCGAAGKTKWTNIEVYSLSMGPTEIWNDRFGFRPKAHDLLANGRSF